MKKMLVISAVIAAAIPSGAGAGAAELPIYELMGFPITTHQVAVVATANVEEQAAVPSLTFGGMPASPHQIAVLTPRSARTARITDAD